MVYRGKSICTDDRTGLKYYWLREKLLKLITGFLEHRTEQREVLMNLEKGCKVQYVVKPHSSSGPKCRYINALRAVITFSFALIHFQRHHLITSSEIVASCSSYSYGEW